MAETRLVRSGPAARALSPVLWLRIAAVLGLLLVWQALGASGLVYPGVLPSWFAIVGALGQFFASSTFWIDFSVTALEVVTALAMGVLAGILAGVALGTGGIVGRGLERYVQYLASTPKVIFLPLVLILFGIGPTSKIALGAFACSFPMMLGTASAMRHVPLVYRRVARGFQLSAWQRMRLVYLPAMLRPIISGMRIALGIAISACLVAELKFSNVGLGSLLVASYEHSRFAEVYALLVIAVGSGAGANALLDRFGRQFRHFG